MVDIKYRLGEKTLRENGKQMIGLSFRPIREWEVLNGREREERAWEREREREREKRAEREREREREREKEGEREGGRRQTGGD